VEDTEYTKFADNEIEYNAEETENAEEVSAKKESNLKDFLSFFI